MNPTVIGDATLYMADCLEVIPRMDSVDGVITDPPYSSGGQFRGDRANDTRTKYLQAGSANQALPDFAGDTRDQRSFHFWSALWASAALSACKSGAIACFFSDWRQLPISTDYMQAGGWIWRGIVPWVKTSYRPQLGRFGAQCEYIVWGSCGPLPVERGVGCLSGFFEHSSPSDREHVTQKPIELMASVVEIVPEEGTVLDPFMGSGTTGVAAIQSGRRFIGVERNPHYFNVACERISAAVNQGKLFAHEMPKPEQQAMGFGV